MLKEDNTIHQARLHWIIFLWPLFFLTLPLIGEYYFPQFYLVALGILGFGLVWLLIAWVTWQVTSLTIKPKQVILRSGFLVRYTTDIPLAKIESMDIRQSILGSLLNYGSLLIIGTGGTKYSMERLSHPLTCRRHIEQLMQNIDAANG